MKKLIVLLLFVGLVAGASASMLKGPYLLYPGTNTQMMVLWQLDTTQTCTLEWGTSVSYGSSTTTSEFAPDFGDGHQHKHTITSLTPGTKYFYRVNDGSYYTGTFYAAPSDSASSVKFLGYGDCRTNPDDMDTVTAKMIAAYQADSEYQTLTLLSGDWVTNGRCDDEWQEQFFNRSYSNSLEMQANLPINGCMGNHEKQIATCDEGDGFLKYYPYPYVNFHYWSFDYGPLHVTVCDQYGDGSAIMQEYQLTWLENDLAGTSKDWKIIQLHAPGYSSDGQGGHTDIPQVQEVVQPLCQDYEVSMVFAGHNHYYTRCEKNEVVHITSGGGGASLDTPDINYTPYVMAVSQTYHYMKFEIDGSAEEMYVTAIDNSGTTVDSFTCDKVYDVSLPWSDGFESGDFAGGGWQTAAKDVSIDTDSYEGTYSARMTKGAWISKEISTKGCTDIHVKYAGKVTSASMEVDWSTDGDTWYNIDSVTSTSWGAYDKTCASGADNKYGFRIRFDHTGGPGSSAFADSVEVTGTSGGEPDTTPPSPDPMTWAGVPDGTSESSVDMIATSATDSSGVEYFFDCVTAGGHDSIWQAGTYYEDTGLQSATSYTYQCKARDKSPNNNETDYSTQLAGTTYTPDTTAPNPDPMEWATVPYATGSDSINMIATTATDPSGVEYFFDCITAGGHDSAWQAGEAYEDTDLDPDSTYTYQVKARDTSSNYNETGYSTTASATTDAGCSASTMHVEAIVCGLLAGCGPASEQGQVTVTIYDNCGDPVTDALVDGTFTGDYEETFYDVATNGSGVATFTTVECLKKQSYQFCVDDVTDTLTYDDTDNVETCDTN